MRGQDETGGEAANHGEVARISASTVWDTAFSGIRGTSMGVYGKDCSILGSVLGSPYHGNFHMRMVYVSPLRTVQPSIEQLMISASKS